MKNRMLESSLEKTARIISQRANVEVIVKGNECPKTNGKRILLPSLPEPCPEEIERVFNGTLDHETAHVMFTDFKVGTRFAKKWGAKGFQVLNGLEDLRIDAKMEGEYPGSKANLANAYGDCLAKWRRNVHRYPLWARTIGCMIGVGKGWSTSMYGEDARAAVSVVQDLVMKASSSRSTKAVAKLAEQVLIRWKAMAEPAEENEAEGTERQGSDEEDGQEGKPSQAEKGHQEPLERDSESETTSESPKPDKQARNAPEAESSPPTPQRTASCTPSPDEAAEAEDRTREVVRVLLGTEPTDEAPDLGRHLQSKLTELPTDGADQPYRVYDRSQDVVEVAADMGAASFERLMSQIRPHVYGLRQKLLLTLWTRAQVKWMPDRNGHRLDRRRLHTLCIDAPSPPPFVRKSESKDKDLAFSLLVDLSGSMSGQRIMLAQQCAALLAETLSRISVDCEVIGFSTVDDRRHLMRTKRRERAEMESQFARFIPIKHTIYKSFGEPFRRCRGRFASMQAQHYTPLNESVLFAGKRLLEHRTSKRILVVLTDGATYLGSAKTQPIAQRNLLQNVKLLRRHGVQTVGVGIGAPFVSEVFARSIVVNELAELPKQFYQLMVNLLLRSTRNLP